MSGSIKGSPNDKTIPAVETAVPVFIGYTEKTRSEAGSLQYKPTRIASMVDYTALFGTPGSAGVRLTLTNDNTLKGAVTILPPRFLLAYAVLHFFANGGGPCFIISAGTCQRAGVESASRLSQLQRALAAAATEESITLLCLPDAALLAGKDYYTLLNAALQQGGRRRDRFAVLDVPQLPGLTAGDTLGPVREFRKGMGTENLSFGAAYYPWLQTNLPVQVSESSPGVLQVSGGTGLPSSLVLRKAEGSDTHNSLYHLQRTVYEAVMAAVKTQTVVVPPCGAVAGTYCRTDWDRGVWKAPGGSALANVLAPSVLLSSGDADAMTVDAVEGKSVNTIRFFTGKGVLLWGARTLAGNDSEWRYVPVRRFFLMVEKSVRKGTAWVTLEPNEAKTWVQVKALTEAFLSQLWRQGALQGVKPAQAFYVAVGLGQSMTEQDIREGRLVLEIGLAVVRPAEFILLRITYKMAPA